MIARRSHRGFLVVVAAVLCSSCVGTVFTSATGDLQHGVSFEFYDSIGRDRAVRVDIEEFEVRRKVPNDKWTTFWLIRGRASVDNIRYGVVPKGLNVVSGPLKLEPGEYEVYGRSSSWSKGTSRGSLLFTIDKDGVVRFEKAP